MTRETTLVMSFLYRPVDWITDIGHELWMGSQAKKLPELLYVDATNKNLVVQKVTHEELPEIDPENPNIKRIVCISDTHERHRSLAVPPGDLLIHSGDIFTINRHFSTAYSQTKLDDFAEWLACLYFTEGKVVIGGNHDAVLDSLGKEDVCRALLQFDEKVKYMEDEGWRTPDGLMVWASPLSYGSSPNSAFQANPEERIERIPENVDILVTHGPLPKEVLKELAPRIHVSGHIHERYGVKMVGRTMCINASIMDGRYQATHGPVVVDLAI